MRQLGESCIDTISKAIQCLEVVDILLDFINFFVYKGKHPFVSIHLIIVGSLQFLDRTVKLMIKLLLHLNVLLKQHILDIHLLEGNTGDEESNGSEDLVRRHCNCEHASLFLLVVRRKSLVHNDFSIFNYK